MKPRRSGRSRWPVGVPRSRWQELFLDRFAIVHDDVFTFLCETATQVDARVKIDDDTKTVEEGQLWYEDHCRRNRSCQVSPGAARYSVTMGTETTRRNGTDS